MSSEMKLRLQIFAIVLAFLCPALALWQLPELLQQSASNGWPAVPGEIEGVVAKPWRDSKGNTKYFGRAIYRYQVDGVDYRSDRTDMGPGTKRAVREEALTDVRQYRPGMKVTVYYDPADPGAGVIEKGIPNFLLVLFLALVVGTIVGWVVTLLTLRSWLRARREAAAAPPTPAPEPIADPLLDGDAIVRQFGAPTAAFRPGYDNMIAGLILGGLLIAGGGAALIFMGQVVVQEGNTMPWSRDQGHCWFSVTIFSGLGLLAVAGGVLLICGMRSLYSLRILVCPEGLIEADRKETRACRWADIQEVEETVLEEHLPLLKGGLKYALPAGSSKSYVLRRRDGTEFFYDRTRVKGLRRLVEAIRKETEQRNIPWNIVHESD